MLGGGDKPTVYCSRIEPQLTNNNRDTLAPQSSVTQYQLDITSNNMSDKKSYSQRYRTVWEHDSRFKGK